MIEVVLSDGALGSPILSRFVGVPSLVASEALDRFDGALLGLAQTDRIGEMLSERAAEDDGFWPAPDHWMARYRPYIISNGVLQIPVKGILLADFSFAVGSYATGYAYLRRAFERGVADPNVRGIAWLHDSGGGQVQECFDLCDLIAAGRGKKPMRAFCEFACSASYALASAADEIVASRTSAVGSIGVLTMHVDFAKALDESGVKVTLIEAPRGGHKTDSYPHKPLSADARERMQDRVDAIYDIFVSTVARNRGVDDKQIRETKALTYMAGPAIEAGLADAVGVVADEVTAFATKVTASSKEAAQSAVPVRRSSRQAKAETDAGPAPKNSTNQLTVQQCAAATKTALQMESERVAGILAMPEAATHPEAARALAARPEVSLEAARKFFAASAPTALSNLPGRASTSEIGLVYSRVAEPVTTDGVDNARGI